MDLKEFLSKTDDLRKIHPDLIRKNPRSVKLIRILLGLFQSEFEKFTGIYRKRISEYELGIYKPTNRTLRKLLNKNVLISLNKIKNPEEVYNRNLEHLQKMRFSGIGRSNKAEWKERGIKFGFKGAEYGPFTEQEKQISNKIPKENVKWHTTIKDPKNELIPINVDLLIEPNTSILLRRVRTNEKKNLERHAIQMALESFRLKMRINNMKVYCLFEAPRIPTKAEHVLNESMDWWTTSIDDLIHKIR